MRLTRLLFVALLCFTAFGLNAQVLTEGFENGTPPANWARLDNGIGPAWFWQGSTTAYQGDSSAFVRYENVPSGVAEDWLVTPALTLGAGDTILNFWQRQAFTSDFGSVYTIRVSTTSQTNQASFTTIFTQTETDFGLNWTELTVNLAAYANQTIFIAFVMTNDDGDNWYLDEMTVGPVGCGVLGLNVDNITTTSANVNWISNSSSNEVEIIPAGATPTGSGVVTGPSPYTATGLMPITSYDVFARSLCIGGGPDTLMITGAYDGPLPGGQPKGIELLVLNDIADLSRYGVSSANNGNGSTAPNPEYVFPAVSASAGDFIYVTADSADFISFFGFSTPYITNAMLINGDDAVELFKDSVVIDVFGDVNTDGTGESWEYLDGWAYRRPGQTPSTTFTDTLWTYSGINQLEGGTTNATTTVPFPIASFVAPNATPSPWVGPVSFTTLCPVITVGNDTSAPFMVPTSAITYVDSGSTVCNSDVIGNPSNDAWYMLITDPCATTIDVSLCNGTNFDSFLRIFDPSLNQLASNDDACGTRSEITGFGVGGGDTLFIVVEGFSTNNGSYTIDITQNLSTPDPTFNYATANYCPGDSNPTPTITGDPGGVFVASNAGLALDSATGLVDLALSTVGSYTVIYTVGNSGCSASDTAQVVIGVQDSVALSYPQMIYCANDSNPLPNVVGASGTFSAPTGVTINATSGQIDLAGSTPGTYAITITTSGTCPAVDSTMITVAPVDSATVTYPVDSVCQNGSSVTPVITGSTGVFSANPGLLFTDTLGTVDPNGSTPGTYQVVYITNGACPATVTNQLTILPLNTAAFAYDSLLYCQSDSVALLDTVGFPPFPGGVFSSSTGAVVDPNTGTIDLVNSPTDTAHQITYTLPASACASPFTLTIGIINCPVGIADGFALQQFKLFPVPNQGRFFLENSGAAVSAQIEVMDLTGRVIFAEDRDFFAGDKREIVLDNAAAGTYFLRARTEDGVQTLRFQVAY
ncbi:MAG: choice-of-anchor J domain-containing protein [Bacteroidota bacterium]